METSTHLLSVVSLLKNSWMLYQKNWKSIIAVVIVTCLISLALIVVGVIAFVILFGVSILAGSSDILNNLAVSIPLLVFGLILFIIFIFVISIVGFWGQIAIYELYSSHKKIGFIDALKHAFPKLFRYWWLGVLAGFLVGGGLLLFLIPGIVFMVWFFFAQLVFVIEGKTQIHPIVKSREYIRGRWFGVVFRLLVLFLLLFIVNYLITFLLSLGGQDMQYLTVGVSLFISYVLLPFVLMPFVFAYMYLLFQNLQHSRVSNVQKSSLLKYILVSLLGYVIFVGGIIFILSQFGDELQNLAKIFMLNQNNTQSMSGNEILYSDDAFSQANDVKRRNDLSAIRSGIYQYYVDNNVFPPGIVEGQIFSISNQGVGDAFCTAIVPDYILEMPSDPIVNNGESISVDKCSDYNTGYSATLENGNVVLYAPQAESGENIEVSSF